MTQLLLSAPPKNGDWSLIKADGWVFLEVIGEKADATGGRLFRGWRNSEYFEQYEPSGELSMTDLFARATP